MSKYLDFFDDVYYINLDYRTDRRENFEKRSTEVGMDAIRFSAIQPELKDCEHIAWWPSEDSTEEQKRLKANQYGCALSHMDVVRKAKERKLSNVLILEDDCIFLDIFKYEIQKCVNDLKKNNFKWDVIFFGGEPNNFCETVTENLSIINRGGVYGLQCYVVNETFYDVILNMPKTIHSCAIMDLFLLHWDWGKRTYLLSKKLLTIQESNYSDLCHHIVETSHFVIGWNKFVTNPEPHTIEPELIDWLKNNNIQK